MYDSKTLASEINQRYLLVAEVILMDLHSGIIELLRCVSLEVAMIQRLCSRKATRFLQLEMWTTSPLPTAKVVVVTTPAEVERLKTAVAGDMIPATVVEISGRNARSRWTVERWWFTILIFVKLSAVLIIRLNVS